MFLIHSVFIVDGAPPTSRDKYLWPFSKTSIWNMPIGSNATYNNVTLNNIVLPVATEFYWIDIESIVSYSQSWLSPLQPMLKAPDFNHMCYEKDVDTPMNYPLNLPIADNFTLPCTPGLANFAGGILYDDNHIREANYLCRCVAGTPITVVDNSWRDAYAIDGDGLPTSGVPTPEIPFSISCGGHGGSCLSGFGGSIRRGELTNDKSVDSIRHALKFTFNMQMFGNLTHNGWSWPATHADGYAFNYATGEAYGYLAQQNNYTTSQYMGMGALLAIPITTNLDNLALESVVGTKLAWTLQNYGGYIVDDSYDVAQYGAGGNRQGIAMEQNVDADLKAVYGITEPVYCNVSSPFLKDLNKIYGALKVITNNSPSSIGGGGVPLQPLAPPFQN